LLVLPPVRAPTWKSRGIFDGGLGKVMESKFYLWCVTAIAMVTK